MNDKIAAEINNVPAKDWLPDTYLPYALYVIRDRALVDSSGMKPVNRRVLWSMFKNGITPSAKHLKTSRCAADAVAYHPHGNVSIEDSIAKMAQDFVLRVPLIDAAGSVGKVTGDVAAAARYWEARLTPASMELLKEINAGAVELGLNYDGELDEPKLLPVRWPVEIINGTQGIAVGYASKMASHNPDEVMEACRRVLKNPDLTIKQLMKIMPGPDLPTGGELFATDGVESYYETGTGTFIIRGRYRVEELTRGKRRIIFYELPYEVSAEQVMTKIHELQSAGQLKEIAVVKDLTDKKNGLRLAIETKAGSNHLNVVNELFRKTPLEAKFPVNATVLVDSSPVKVSMLDLIRNFLEFRKICTVKRTEARMAKIDKRLEHLDGVLAVLVDIDKAIAIIRSSETGEDARNNLIREFSTGNFTMTTDQADYILSMQLRRLTKQDSAALLQEKTELNREKVELDLILAHEDRLAEVIDADLVATKKIIGSKRRTVIAGLTTEELKESMRASAQAARDVDKNLPCVVTRFADGRLIKTDAAFRYENGARELSHSPIVEQIKMKTQDSIVLVGSDGMGHRIPLSYLTIGIIMKPEKAGVQLNRGVKLVGICKAESMKSDVGLALATDQGGIKIAKTDFPKTDEFPVILLDEGETVVDCRWLGKTLTNTWFALTSQAGNVLIFGASTIRAAGARSGSVKGMKLKDVNDRVIAFDWLQSHRDPDTFLMSQAQHSIKITSVADIPTKNKGGMGVVLHGFGKGENKLSKAFAGRNLALTLAPGGNVVNLPMVTRRAARGAEFNLKVLMGSTEVTPL